jgi:ABC-type phosphate transport system permease subunit
MLQEKYMAGLPSIVFGLTALVPALLALLLPDTSKSALPDHIDDAERIGEESREQDTKHGQDAENPR